MMLAISINLKKERIQMKSKDINTATKIIKPGYKTPGGETNSVDGKKVKPPPKKS